MWVVYWSEWVKEQGRNNANPNHSRGSPSPEMLSGQLDMQLTPALIPQETPESLSSGLAFILLPLTLNCPDELKNSLVPKSQQRPA